MRNFGEVNWRALRLGPDRQAVLQDGVALTHAQLEDRAQRCAALLWSRGVRPGDRVLLLMPNEWHFPEVLLGVLRCGAVVVPLNLRQGAEPKRYIASDCGARLAVAHARAQSLAADLLAAGGALQDVLVAGGDGEVGASYDDLLDTTAPGFTTVPVQPDDVAVQLYTSGSTGRPKGCLLTHEGHWWHTTTRARVCLHDETDVALAIGPLYHAAAMWVCLFPMLLTGGAVAMLPSFSAAGALQALERHRATYTSGTPAILSLLLAEAETLATCDLSALQWIACGSAPVTVELLAQVREAFGCEVSEGYGLSEGGAMIQTPRWGIRKPGSAGLPLPGVDIRVADLEDLDRDCATGEIGELWTRSPANALGYHGRPDVTAERFPGDGWLRTGDLVRLDEQGYVCVSGRIDDMINTGGENVYPKEVENVLLSHPGIAEACVVPVDHPVKGQVPVAWVVARRGAALDPAEVKAFFLSRAAAYAHPRQVLVTGALPVLGTGKVDRARLEREARSRVAHPDRATAGTP